MTRTSTSCVCIKPSFNGFFRLIKNFDKHLLPFIIQNLYIFQQFIWLSVDIEGFPRNSLIFFLPQIWFQFIEQTVAFGQAFAYFNMESIKRHHNMKKYQSTQINGHWCWPLTIPLKFDCAFWYGHAKPCKLRLLKLIIICHILVFYKR